MPKSKFKILVIEDDPTQGLMYELALSSAGFEVTLADTGQKGLDAVKKVKPDLVFLDMILGDMQGIDILKKIRADKQTANLKVAVLSNLNKKELVDECKTLGVIDFIIKMQFLPKDIVAKAKQFVIQ